jgi:MFS family permease
MIQLRHRISWRPTRTTFVAGALILAGILLSSISWGFVFLVGLGMLGPGLLRELGWLKDQDEFQRQAARRAGYHAFLATGLLAFFFVALLRTGNHGIQDPESVVSLLLAVLWFTWILSSLLGYWGPRRTARTILVTFGIFWLIFSVASSIHSLPMLLMQSLVAVPFFALAWVAGRWPKAAGVLLLAASAFFFYFFGLYEIFGREPLDRGRGFVIVIFIGPLCASGVALLAARRAVGAKKSEVADTAAPRDG